MKQPLLAAAILAGAFNVLGDTAIPAVISANTTWSLASSPYVASGTVTVSPGVTLTIEPGVTAKFPAAAWLRINGTLVASGTTSSRVQLSPTSTTWSGLYLAAGGAASSLSYVTITSGGDQGWFSGAVVIENNSTLTGVTVTGSRSRGIQIQGAAAPSISGSSVTASNGLGIETTSTGVTLLKSTAITNNTQSAIRTTSAAGLTDLTGLTATGNEGGAGNRILFQPSSISGTVLLRAASGIPWHAPATTIYTTAGATLVIDTGATYISGGIGIVSGSALEMKPGSTYISEGGTISVSGKLTAVGTAASLAQIRGQNQVRGGWGGLILESSADPTSRIAYASIRHAGNGVQTRGSSVTIAIANTTISDCSGNGIELNAGGATTVTSCTIRDNGYYGIRHNAGTLTVQSTAFLRNLRPIYSGAGLPLLGLTGNTQTANQFEGIERPGGTIGSNTLIRRSSLPYVYSSLTVAAQATLTVESGTTVKFDGWLQVSGRLVATGTSTSRIILTRRQEGAWYGVQFLQGSSGTLAYVDILNGYTSAIAVVSDSSPTFDHVTLASWNRGVQVRGSGAPVFRSCTFAANPGTGTGYFDNLGTGKPDARLNYWSAANGPSGNGPGSGVQVLSNVLFEPFLTAGPSTPNFATTFTTLDATFNPTIQTSTRFTFALSQSGTWTVTILSGAASIRTYTGSGTSGTVSWDGRDSGGLVQPNGTYYYELTATSTAGKVATPARGRSVIDSAKQPTLVNVSISEAYFSPNGDSIRETTTLAGTTNFETATWRVDVRNSSGAVVRTQTGTSTAVSFAWNGKNGSAALQPDGSYTLEAVVSAGSATTTTSRSTILDATFPTTVLTAPAANAIISNIYSAGSTVQLVQGTASDTNMIEWSVWSAPAATPTQFTQIAVGANNLVNATLAQWETVQLAGSYILRLRGIDRAGSVSILDRTVTVGHLSVTQSTFDLNGAAGGTLTYTSKVPFDLRQTIVIRDPGGTPVRTLIDTQRTAGTFTNAWDGRNDQGSLLPDGPYSYVSTVTAGSTVFTWDRSNVKRSNTSQAAEGSGWGLASFTVSGGTNPFANDPRIYQYSLTTASLVQISVVYPRSDGSCHDRLWMVCQQPGEVPAPVLCVNGKQYKPSGSHIFRWPGTYTNGLYLAGMDCTGVLFNLYDFPENVAVLFGTAPSITYPLFSPTSFDPAFGPQEITFTLSTYQGQTATITVDVVSQAELSVVRTLTFPNLSPGSITIPWDGEGVSEVPLAPGRYTFIFTVTDLMGNSTVQHAVSRIGY